MSNTSADVSGWSQQLSDGDVKIRREAASRLMQAGSAGSSAATALVQAVGDEDEEVANCVTEALENLGPPPAEDLQQLIRLLSHENPDCGYWAATLVGRLGSAAAAAVSDLCAVVQSGTALSARERAVWALGEIGPAAHAARQCLQAAARGDAPRLARLAQESLERIGDSSAAGR